MTISATKLERALRRRFRSPSAAIRALGLDQNALSEPAGERDGLNGEHAAKILDFAVKKLRASPEQISQLHLFLKQLLGESATARAEDDDDETADDPVEKLRAYLREQDMSDADIAGAVDALGVTASAGTSVGGAAAYGGDQERLRDLPRDLDFGTRPSQPAKVPAMDAAMTSDFERRFPGGLPRAL